MDAKHDKGKHQLALVPTQGIKDVAQVREYGNARYGDSDSWLTVSPERYLNALYRHLLDMVDDMYSIDKESGIAHYKHVACNAMFLCELLANKPTPQRMLTTAEITEAFGAINKSL